VPVLKSSDLKAGGSAAHTSNVQGHTSAVQSVATNVLVM